MQFVQVGMLGALAALAIPIIIHLMFRSRARPVDLGTLQFLKVVLRDNARRRRLRRWLLLALRMASLALIAFLFARPYMLATEPAAGDRLVVVLIDRSASMGLQGGTRPIDQALTEARAILARAGDGTQLEVATFDETVNSPGSPRPSFARPRLNQRRPAPTTASRWPGLATFWSAPAKVSRNCISSPIFSAPASIAVKP